MGPKIQYSFYEGGCLPKGFVAGESRLAIVNYVSYQDQAVDVYLRDIR